jgi:transposase
LWRLGFHIPADYGGQLSASLIATCRTNGKDSHTWLTATLIAIVNGHKQNQINELLSRDYATKV